MEGFSHSTIGLAHLYASILAMAFGTFILFAAKGTKLHKRAGYLYFVAMLATNGSAFLIYDLYGHFGPFHWAAVFSLLTLVAGMVPAIRKKPARGWKRMHGTFMYYSVLGLYAAFFSEILTRVPASPFYPAVLLATCTTLILGSVIFYRLKPRWFPGRK